LTVEEISKLKKILIIRLSSLGDILLATPFLRSLKKQFPSLEIDMIVREEYADTIKLNPHIRKQFNFSRNDEANKNLISNLSIENYELVIDLQSNFRSKGIVKELKIKTEKFHKKSWEKFLLVNFKINKLKTEPQIPIRYAATITNFKLDDKGIDLISNKPVSELIIGKSNLIGFCPGARHFTKRWLTEYFINLGNLLSKKGYQIVLFGGETDREICREIAGKIPDAIDLSNDNDLLQIVSDMKQCLAVVCNDSGLMHVASATGTKVIAIFGSTVKEFGFTPYNCNNLILENNSLSCRPCSHIGKDHCPKGHFKCMKEIKPDLVFQKVTSLISNQ
jgi:heptosyltransferase-2